MNVLNSREKKRIVGMLREAYGCEDVFSKFALLMSEEKEKIWIANPELFTPDLSGLNVTNIGLYFGRMDKDKIRLSREGSQMVGKTANRNIAEVDNLELIKGENVKAVATNDCDEGEYVLVKYKEDFIGIARYKNGLLENVAPRGRKMRIED
jgi:NOL1/NOP2/fmu family ribosome biogenesis protein